MLLINNNFKTSAATATVEELIAKESSWKKEKLQKLSKIVQDKIHSIQVSFFE